MLHRNLLLAIALSAGGCATITTDAGQSIRVEAFTETGEEIKGAQCQLQNDNGKYNVSTPGSVSVRKSANDLVADCSAPNLPDAHAALTSRVGIGMFGNIIFGGAVGVIIDHSKGTAYNYPTWVQLVFGKVLSFDRNDFQEGQPTPPFELKEGKREPYSRTAVKLPAPAAPASAAAATPTSAATSETTPAPAR